MWKATWKGQNPTRQLCFMCQAGVELASLVEFSNARTIRADRRPFHYQLGSTWTWASAEMCLCSAEAEMSAARVCSHARKQPVPMLLTRHLLAAFPLTIPMPPPHTPTATAALASVSDPCPLQSLSFPLPLCHLVPFLYKPLFPSLFPLRLHK